MRILSVDLGTSNTVAVLSAHGRPPRVVEVDGSATMPSAVFAEEDGTLVVGRDAERRARLDPTRFEPNPKRRVDEQTLLLGTDVVPVNEALAAVLRRVLDETSRQLGGEQPDEIRLTHPAQWGPVRRNVLLSAARLAGMTGSVSLVPEPVAAAAHFASFPGKALGAGQTLAVYDLGAGTFDVAVVGATQNGYTVLAEDGLPDLGGLDVDQALLVHVGREVSHRDPQHWQRLLRPESTADRRTRRTLQEDVKAAKEALSRLPQTEVPMPEPFTDVLVTRAELEALVRPAMLRSVELLARTVRAAGLSPDRLAGIYLVGGSSRLPLVGTLLAEKLGVVPSSLDQPETAVALGAHHVASDGISMRTQNVEGQVASAGVAPPQQAPGATGPHPPPQVAAVPGYAPPAAYQQQPAYPNSGPQPALATQHAPGANFPSYPAAPDGKGEKNRKKLLIGAAIAAVVLIAASTAFFLWPSSSATTYTAEECREPGQTDQQGFTGCLRQLAGDLADTSQCGPGTGTGPAAAANEEELGVTVTCSAPGLAGAQVTYLHGSSRDVLKQYTDGLLNRTGGGDRVEADWGGNALEGSYSASAGRNSSVLVFTVDDRPLSGFIYQVNATGEGESAKPGALADYFEQNVQPGE
ncbi:molecular chaperone Hsp70 [Prauserella sp. PE36]|uniref:Hsp70 family protein n=1 Tax=Prauserella endophytica TaxID=1592324 RepID=A0ABY2S1W2_9PSEU|nr:MULTISPECIES: Hsp70 family protein [Prauserella]PXY25017.1 molecular chaperone Hsp70 [Prauserella coralliicola]RBM23825.1 molecular chaperone Hsp70 [Prauserella sp. PE36]TKG69094.1 Hsp70 family protein [Prauserella endophytica]